MCSGTDTVIPADVNECSAVCSSDGSTSGTAVAAGSMWNGASVVTGVCRAAATACDVAESCDGASVYCPADTFADASVEARAAASVCDVAEMCSGTDGEIPADAFADASVEARAAASV